MGVDFSNSVVARHTKASLTYTSQEGEFQKDTGEMSNGMLNVATSSGVMCEPSGKVDPRTGKYTENNGTILEWAFCGKQGAGPKEAVRGGEGATAATVTVEAADPNKRPPTLPDHLGQGAHSVR
jgi:hypothetical protein